MTIITKNISDILKQMVKKYLILQNKLKKYEKIQNILLVPKMKFKWIMPIVYYLKMKKKMNNKEKILMSFQFLMIIYPKMIMNP